ncbi:MAG: hypothetical protein FWD75_03220 [Propionibacteriaceae bacterium]|nr:hypothetical protein [Propionibacteriaceae bacterium]
MAETGHSETTTETRKEMMMVIDGVEYVRAEEVTSRTDHVCVIASNGWIFEGWKTSDDSPHVRLVNANVVRSWSNGLGIGGLADPEHKDEYTLDKIGSITVRDVIAEIDLRW